MSGGVERDKMMKWMFIIVMAIASTPASATIGAVAHLGERIPCTDEVAGSIPVSSTKSGRLCIGKLKRL